MNQETIENHVKSLSKSDFDGVATLILTRVYGFTVIDVDGKGDGGSDRRVLSDSVQNRLVSIQVTVQDASWVAKALRDAKKAVEELAAKRYFFLTSRARESKELRRLENEIETTLSIPARCFGATEIAGMIIENGLLGDFAEAIGLPLELDIRHRADRREILLHSYFSLSDDRANLRRGTYEKALLLTAHYAPTPLRREELVRQAGELLAIPAVRQEELARRVDSLLSRGRMRKVDDVLRLSPEVALEMKTSDGLYLREVDSLTVLLTDLLAEHGGTWGAEQSLAASTLLAEMFVAEQIETAKRASLSLTMTGFLKSQVDPKDALLELISKAGVTGRVAALTVLRAIVDVARELPLIRKLTDGVVFIALEETGAGGRASMLGASSWRDVSVILDTSVAIPFLCSCLSVPTTGRFSQGARESLHVLQELGATTGVPWVYLNECASHLVRAAQYCIDVPELEGDLCNSQNGYVAHYHRLRLAGARVPHSLGDFIRVFSDAALRQGSPDRETVRKVMSDLQPLFEEYGIGFHEIPAPREHFTREATTEYAYVLRDLNRSKSSVLTDHDTQVLAHLSQRASEQAMHDILLTWDRTMIDVARKLKDCGWVVSPHDVADLAQASTPLSQGALCALAHSVARTLARPEEIGGRIIDRIILLAGANLAEWEFRQKAKLFRDEALNRLDASGKLYDLRMFDDETDRFLRDEGVDVLGEEKGTEDGVGDD